jgi:hypothetical protein
MIQSRHFFILTDHMPIIFAFQQKKDRFSSRHFDQLDDLFLFTTEIRYEFGQDNVVADALPRMKTIAASQVGEDEVRRVLDWNTTPRLEKVYQQHLPALLRQICRKISVLRTSTSTKAGIRFLAHCVIPKSKRTPGTQDCRSRVPASNLRSPDTPLLHRATSGR